MLKGFNVRQGGAAGMLLVNPSPQDVETDNHWLPAVHLDAPAGTDLAAFFASHPGTTVTFTTGAPEQGRGDVVASFSSRGPGGAWIKPDLTAPGVSILAGQTPTPESPSDGPPGQYYQAIAGTSMAAPHVTGAAALLRALHPAWTPGQIKSALMTTAHQGLILSDGSPAGVFDQGSGRIDLTRAGDPGVTFSDTAQNMFIANGDTGREANVNIPSVDVTTVAGSISVIRTATNVTSKKLKYKIVTESDSPDVTITATPRPFQLRAGQSKPLTITIDAATAAPGQYTGAVLLQDQTGSHDVRIPVAFVTPGRARHGLDDLRPELAAGRRDVALRHHRDQHHPDRHDDRPHGGREAPRDHGHQRWPDPGRREDGHGSTTLAAALDPSIALARRRRVSPAGPVRRHPDADRRRGQVTFNVPGFAYGGVTYNSISVDSNGYIVVGGSGATEDNNCCNIVLPSPARPNNVLAPFWADLDGTGAPGILATASPTG